MESYKGMLYLIGAFSLAGSSVIAASLVNGRLGVFTITAVSLLLSMICLLPFQWKETMAAVRRLTAGEWMLLACQALFGVFLFRLFLLYGLTFTSSAEAGILTGATPALTVLLARLLLREKLESYKMAGIACTVAGIILIQGFLAPESLLSMAHLWGNALVLCAAASEASFNVLSRAAAVRSAASGKETVHPLTQTTLVSSIAFFLCVVPSLFENPLTALSAIGWHAWLALVWYGPFVTGLAFMFWYAGIQRTDAATAAGFSGMMPFTAFLLSVAILNEQAGWRQWAGCIMVVIGMALIGGFRYRRSFHRSKKAMMSLHK